MFVRFGIVLIILSTSTSYSKINPGDQVLQAIKDKLGGPVDQFDDDLQNPSTNFSDIPPVKEGELILKEKCEKNGGNNSYEEVMKAKVEVQECFKNLINFTELPKRVREASPSGDVDLVFQDYCRQSSELKGCVNNFLFKIEPCLAENEKSSKYTVQNITEAIFSFVCDREGNNIAVFYTEDGLECIMSRKIGIEKCLNATLADDAADSTEKNHLFSLTFNLDQCRSVVKLRRCITAELMECQRSTAANVVDSVFNLVQSSTPCSQFSKEELGDESNKSYSIHQAVFSILVPIITVHLARIY